VGSVRRGRAGQVCGKCDVIWEGRRLVGFAFLQLLSLLDVCFFARRCALRRRLIQFPSNIVASAAHRRHLNFPPFFSSSCVSFLFRPTLTLVSAPPQHAPCNSNILSPYFSIPSAVALILHPFPSNSLRDGRLSDHLFCPISFLRF
jgi:hypothetical protein